MALTPEQRTLRARMAAYRKWELATPARARKITASFEQQVDPGMALTPQERARRANIAREDYFREKTWITRTTYAESRDAHANKD